MGIKSIVCALAGCEAIVNRSSPQPMSLQPNTTIFGANFPCGAIPYRTNPCHAPFHSRAIPRGFEGASVGWMIFEERRTPCDATSPATKERPSSECFNKIAEFIFQASFRAEKLSRALRAGSLIISRRNTRPGSHRIVATAAKLCRIHDSRIASTHIADRVDDSEGCQVILRLRCLSYLAKMIFGHMACTPTFPSTSCVMSTSTATLVSM